MPHILPEIGEEVRLSQRHGMHNNVTFRRSKYLIDVESPITFGWTHVSQLAQVLDGNYLRIQEALEKEGPN